MSVSTTIPEIIEAIKALKAGVRQAVKAMTDLSVDHSKLESKLGKTEAKLELAKAKGTAKKGSATATATTATTATVASNSAVASETSSVGSDKPLTATAAKELPAIQQLIGMVTQLDELTALVKGLPKPGKVKSVVAVDPDAEPKGPTNAHIAWQPATLFPDKWAAFKAECQPAKDAIKEQIAALDSSDPLVAELKKRQRQIGSVMAFNALCREVTHKAEWEAFQAAWAVEHPKKAMGGGGAL
jgi:hypothetical protein